MKSIVFASLALFLLAGVAEAQEKQKKETIEGNGKMMTRTMPVTTFDALKASGVYELKLAQGATESVKIEADENLHEYFNVKNEGSRLVIDMKKLENKNFNSKSKLKVFVTFKKLKEMELSMVGNVGSEQQLTFDDLDLKNKSVGNVDLKLNVQKLNLENTSVGNVKLTGKADNAVVKHSGVGSLEAGNFVVQNMNIDNSSVGHAKVNAQKDLKVKDSFMGKVENKGKASARKMNKVKV